MNRPDVIEFYVDDQPLLRVDSSIVPFVGSYVSIAHKTYKVAGVSFAIDYSERVFERQLRANIELQKEKK